MRYLAVLLSVAPFVGVDTLRGVVVGFAREGGVVTAKAQLIYVHGHVVAAVHLAVYPSLHGTESAAST